MSQAASLNFPRLAGRIFIGATGLAVVALLVWQAIVAAGVPNPLAVGAQARPTVAILDIGVLVFREGLECVLVLAAITASMVGENRPHRRPVAAGAGIGFLATLATWFIAAGIVDDLSGSFPALDVQAATGLLAIVVLLVVMNWFFHKLYWTGWISVHNRRKRTLLARAAHEATSRRRLLCGLGLLGFSALYREGFEVVLFLQSYKLKLGEAVVFQGVAVGLFFTAIVTVLTFVAHRRLPYRRMLVLTGVLLGVVLLVMVGEEAQEMQLARWLPTTGIGWLEKLLPGWLGLWFSVFPTVETLAAQGIAAVLVLGSYALARAPARRQRCEAACATEPPANGARFERGAASTTCDPFCVSATVCHTPRGEPGPKRPGGAE